MLDESDPSNVTNDNADPQSTISRRNFFKKSFTASVTAFSVAPALSEAKHLGIDGPEVPEDPSPPVIPWAETFPSYMFRPNQSLSSLNPPPQRISNVEAGECGRNPIPRFDEFFGGNNNVDYYELHLREALHTFNPAYPAQPIWGYDGIFPGPTFHARYGRPVVVRLFNELPLDHVGYGAPESALHLHNLHSTSESDGFPGDYFSPEKAGPTLGDLNGANEGRPGRFRDHCYHMVYAGLDASRRDNPNAIGDPREALGSLWYHDHSEDATAPNVVKGELGAFLLYDDLDSGDENDSNPNALRLPSGDYDVPLMFNDMRFDQNGLQVFDQFDEDGTFGDVIVVNGKIKPFFNVARRRYRIRLYNSGPSRQYLFRIERNGVSQPFVYISNDGNLLEFPIMNETSVHLAVAERGDIIIDFANYPIGAELYIVNYVDQDSTRKPDGILDDGQGIQVLKFIVNRDPSTPDNSRILNANTFLRALPPIDLSKVVTRREFDFERRNGVWVVNGNIFNVFKSSAVVQKGTAEIWKLKNGGGGWAHPIHIHFEEGRILSVNGQTPPPHMRGRKDVYDLQPGYEMEVYIQFRDFNGKYVMHCHNVIHEDHAMMVRFDIVGDEEAISNPISNAPYVTLAPPVSDLGNKTGYIEATASDPNGTITKVEFYYGENLLSTTTSAPYRASWTNAPDGNYAITARAYDNQGNMTISNTMNVLVDSKANDLQITLTLNHPVANAGNKTGYIEATATDPYGAINHVDFYYGNTLLASDGAVPYRASWSNVPNGNYVITAKAFDNKGGITTSNAIEVIVSANESNTAPTVTLKQPVGTNGNKTGSIEAVANDPDGSITKVEFYHGTALLSTATTVPYRAIWSNVPNGTYEMTARAYDNQGAITTSNQVTVIVNGK
jgi:FtsP/CotA-like multicopper oxidase with cupredoxin domain